MLGHRSLDMTLRYAKIANRTVADEYFAVTEKVDALYEQARAPARRRPRPEHGPAVPRAPPPPRKRLLHPAPRRSTARSRTSAKPAPSSRPASSSGPPCKPSTTTPTPRDKPTEPSSSPASSTAPTTRRPDMTRPSRPHQALPRYMPPRVGAPEASTWSTRSAASMNDVDTDQHRQTLGSEEAPTAPSHACTDHDHRHNAADGTSDPAADRSSRSPQAPRTELHAVRTRCALGSARR